MSSRRFRAVICSIAVALLAACAVEVGEDGDQAISVASQSNALELSRTCTDRFEDIYAQPKNLPAYSQSRRGDIVRCAQDRTIPIEEISTALARRGFVGVTARYAVKLYRITYRTERLARRGDVSSAIVVLPTGSRRAGVAETAEVSFDEETLVGTASVDAASRGAGGRRAPLIVFGHGTVPYGNTCAYSRADPALDPLDTELGSLLAFATRGFPVIMPDYAGFVSGSPVAGYLLSEDEAHSLLDATRAMQKVLRDPPQKVALVGHSQGGHAVLSAQALARSYGLAGQLVGVATFAPFWAVGRAFGVIVAPEAGYNTHDDPGPMAFAIEYFYTHAEVYDGVGRGQKLFQPGVRSALQGFVSSCQWGADPSVLGATASNFLQPDFLAAVGNCGLAGGAACSGGIAGTWETRFRADRPALDRSGAPVVMWHGANDAVIAPAFAKCAIDKLTVDLPKNSAAKFTFCGDAMADHESLLARDLAWTTQWITARAVGGPEPAACPGESAIQGSEGALVCPAPPGNVD